MTKTEPATGSKLHCSIAARAYSVDELAGSVFRIVVLLKSNWKLAIEYSRI